MEYPRFRRDTLSEEQAQQDIGDAFQRFAYEILRFENSGLREFPGKGNDGGIDLSVTKDRERKVFECKHIGTDGKSEALSRWSDVADNLRTHLSDPDGPTTGQGQYSPWYNTEEKIQEYVFCISSQLKNQNQHDEVTGEIRSFFREFGSEHDHLSHLAEIDVNVVDWKDLEAELDQHPQIVLKWFPSTRPLGLVPLNSLPEPQGLRAYIRSETLPYYSRSEHLCRESAPEDAKILDEETLLSQLTSRDVTGLILTGGGGIGKTRLMHEVGHIALKNDWVVFRVGERLRAEALEEVVKQSFSQETSVLLLIDYIETQQDFSELTDLLNDYNTTYEANVNYIACCRTSYYPSVRDTSNHLQVDLTPHDAAESWLENYRHYTVRHILEQSGIGVTETHLTTCADLPILAVFMAYLHGQGRTVELQNLLEEQDFGRWITKRVQQSFPNENVMTDLASLVTFFPMTKEQARGLDSTRRDILLKLSSDKWIEQKQQEESPEEVWVTVHDVLADQILLAYLSSIRDGVELFVAPLLKEAMPAGHLQSVLLTLQRLADQPHLQDIQWFDLFNDHMGQNPEPWREVQNILIRTPLLTTSEAIQLLHNHSEVWSGAETSIDFQNALGWHARKLTDDGMEELSSELQETLFEWIEKAASNVDRTNYIITSGLKVCPERVREKARDWIKDRPRLFQTHYLLVAWLEELKSPESIANAVKQWSERYGWTQNFSFVAKAWLDAGGNRDLLKNHIRGWLDEHQTEEVASYVCRGWLNAGGDKGVVEEHVRTWLDEHAASPAARFLYKGWLDAGGDPNVINAHLLEWLEKHGMEVHAEFVLSAWLDATGDLDVVETYVRAWLEKHETELKASYVCPAWLNAGGDLALVEEHLRPWFGVDPL